MKRFILSLFLFGLTALGQNQPVNIVGTVSNPEGAGVTGITVEIRDAAGAILSTTTTSATGTFSFSRLTAGTYQLTVPGLGFRFLRYVGDKLAVNPGETSRVDVHLNYANQGVVGDDNAFLA